MEVYDKNVRDTVVDVFMKIQDDVCNHQKSLQTLKALYRTVDLEAFVNEFVRCLELVFVQDHRENKVRHKRILSFAALFCSEVLIEYEKNNETADDDAENPFLEQVVDKTLAYIELSDVDCRYHSCLFVSLLLDTVGSSVHLSSKLCDDIQDALLEKLQDSVMAIRLVCVGALMRLQDPGSNECPVIKAFILAFEDQNPLVRKEVITHIAYTITVSTKMIEHLRDIDYTVRVAVFNKIGAFSPRSLKIEQRHFILLCGLEEEHKAVKTAFENGLLVKWLKHYDDNLLALLRGLKLDADYEDVKQTQKVYDGILKMYFKSLPLDEVIERLPLDDQKLVPLDKLNTEISSYWFQLITFLQNDEQLAPEVDVLLVELTPLCKHIQSYIKMKTSRVMESFEYYDFQVVLNNLLRIASISDFTDEAGRANLQQLITTTLVNTKLNTTVIRELLNIYKVLVTDVDRQCVEICTIISDIREPTCAENEGSEDSLELSTNKKFEIAQLKTKLFRLEDEKDQAVATNQYSEAERLHKEMQILKMKIKEMTAPVRAPEPVVTKELKTDTATVCRCLDILSVFLEITRIKKLPPSLRSCLLEFVKPSMTHVDIEAYGRIFRIVGQYSVLDKDIAVTELKNICSPLFAYRHGKIDKASLMVTMQGISDIIRTHGPDVFGENADTTFDTNSTRRKLYRVNELEDALSDNNNISGGLVMDILLGLLDEEEDDIRHCATNAISKVIMTGMYVGPSLLARLCLKWLNPSIEKHDIEMQQILGQGIMRFAFQIEDSGSIFEKAIVPILCSVGNAPITSPLAEIDVDHMLGLLSKLAKVRCNNFNAVHKNLAFAIISEIKRKSTLKCVIVLSKMLLFLDRPHMDDETTIEEILNELKQTEHLNIDKQAIKNLMKYTENMNALRNREEVPEIRPDSTENKENDDPEQHTVTSVQQMSELQTGVSNIDITLTAAAANLMEVETNVNGVNDLNSSNSSCSGNVFETAENNLSANNDSTLSNLSMSSSGSESKRKRGRPKRTSLPEDTTLLHTIIEHSEEVSKLLDDSDVSDVSRISRKSPRNLTPTTTPHSQAPPKSTRSRKKHPHSSTSDSPDEGTPVRRSARKRVKKVR